MSDKEDVQEVLAHFSTGMLCTRRDGMLRARPMAIARAEKNGDVLFVTSLNSGKVEEVLSDSRALVTFQSTRRYLSLSGEAHIEYDERVLDEVWKDEWNEWFPQGKGDPSVIVIRLRAAEAEYWFDAGAKRVVYAFEQARAALTGKPDKEEHGRVRL
jgi:general stress protein 26